MEYLNIKSMWGDNRYHSLDYEMKSIYGRKIFKICLNGGMSCPNRDGTLDNRGCIFCSAGGSGDFAGRPEHTIEQQMSEGKKLLHSKLPPGDDGLFIAYFQAYTNTYGPISYLRELFTQAINQPEVAILSIATRPDCLGKEVLALLDELNQIKPVWIELGLQTIHEPTAAFIRRGYPLSSFEDAVVNLSSLGIDTIVHTILGLPNESKHDMLKTMEYLANQPIQGVKLQLLHVLEGTDLGTLYKSGSFNETLTLDQYIDLVISCLEVLPGDVVIHRITGDGPKNLLLSPQWSSNKKLVLNSIHREMKIRNTWQGKRTTSQIRNVNTPR